MTHTIDVICATVGCVSLCISLVFTLVHRNRQLARADRQTQLQEAKPKEWVLKKSMIVVEPYTGGKDKGAALATRVMEETYGKSLVLKNDWPRLIQVAITNQRMLRVVDTCEPNDEETLRDIIARAENEISTYNALGVE